MYYFCNKISILKQASTAQRMAFLQQSEQTKGTYNFFYQNKLEKFPANKNYVSFVNMTRHYSTDLRLSIIPFIRCIVIFCSIFSLSHSYFSFIWWYICEKSVCWRVEIRNFWNYAWKQAINSTNSSSISDLEKKPMNQWRVHIFPPFTKISWTKFLHDCIFKNLIFVFANIAKLLYQLSSFSQIKPFCNFGRHFHTGNYKFWQEKLCLNMWCFIPILTFLTI